MYYTKRIVVIGVVDSILICIAFPMSIMLSSNNINLSFNKNMVFSLIFLLISYFCAACINKLFKKNWKFTSIGDLLSIINTITICIIINIIVQKLFLNVANINVLFITWMLLIILVGGTRLGFRLLRNTHRESKSNLINTMIIGAGSAGQMVARQMRKNTNSNLNPIGFLDDDPKKYHLEILGLPVLGTTKDINECTKKNGVQLIVIAIPSLSKKNLKRIFEECKKTKIKTQTIPMLEDIITGKLSVKEFKDIDVNDLLFRKQVDLNEKNIKKYIAGKTVLITGAGGSIGSEICRQICNFKPNKLLLLGHGENSIYSINLELNNKYGNCIKVIPIIAEIQDRKIIFEVMKKYKPDVVYHAAAHKHVPLMEENPKEAIKNNIIGTKNVAEAAAAENISVFVMISTDKAVKPTSVMGATKRISEMIVQSLNVENKTKFVIVRFGNVLGSRGSVVPLFEKQLAEGGPLTVTDSNMTRYFMTISEAAKLVIQAGSLAEGGELFILDMGQPVKIIDLAKNIIELAGYSTDEIEIKISGIRPGEKLHEELSNKNEVLKENIFPKIHVGRTTCRGLKEIMEFVNNIDNYTDEELREILIALTNSISENMKLRKI